MLKNYFILGFRNLRKHLNFSLLNLFGLILGISSCILIFLVVKYELNYDSFYKKADRTYRVTWHRHDYSSSVSMGIIKPLRNDFPELEEISLTWPKESGLIKVGEKRFLEKNYAFVDEHFSNIFDYEWLEGNSKTALSEPNTIVLTESIAKKYFGSKDPVGRVITLDKIYDLKVTGLIKDIPANTHLPLNFLVSFQTLKKDLGEEMYKFYTIAGASAYVVLPENVSSKSIEKKLPGFIKKNWGQEIAKENELLLQPLKEIHFDQRYQDNPFSATTSREIYWALEAVAFFILLMACINFINLSTTQAITRAKEVGIRKTLGGTRRQLIFQFMSETLLLVFFALGISIVISTLSIPQIGKWLDIKITFSQLGESSVITQITGITLALILLAGLYPAFIQSGFNPINALNNKAGISQNTLTLRKSLVVLQFVISQIMIAATLIVGLQMNFLRNKDLGFNKEAVISFDLPDNSKREILAQQLANDPGIKEISSSSGAPSYNAFYTPIHSADLGIIKDEVSEIRFIDEYYIKMFELKILAGKENSIFNKKDTTHPLLVNEEMLRVLGIKTPEEAIGKRVTIYWTINSVIRGVVKDFQSESKHKARRPCILYYSPSRFLSTSIKLNPKGMHQTIERIEKTWSTLFPKDLFNYEFIDDHIAAQYRKEENEYAGFRLFSIIAILIGCIGLYGLVTFAAVQRTKEIGVRKVLGAGIMDIVKLLSINFLSLAVIASCIAFPATWYFMNKWLQNFAYHVSITWWMFLVAGLFSILIALITLSHQAFKAAIANPVKSLRTE